MIRLEQLKKVLPKLSYNTTKGANGIIGVIGGSIQYTGAPYYAAMSALKMGADLVHIFCSKQSAIPIKSYSPQLIVHPVFDYDSGSNEALTQDKINKMVQKWIQYFKSKLQRINCWVIGPGLGRSEYLSNFFFKFIRILPQKTNIVIDADGLFFLCKFPQLLQNLKQLNCILTPNHREFFHLNKLLKLEDSIVEKIRTEKRETGEGQNQGNLHKFIANKIVIKNQIQISMILKGQKDIIFHKGNQLTVVDTKGGIKRCGGIGDILAGCVACCYLWDNVQGPVLACHIVKLAAYQAFKKHGRSLTAPGVLEEVETVVKQIDQLV